MAHIKVDLSTKSSTNPSGDVDTKDVYSAFSEVAEYVWLGKTMSGAEHITF